MTDKPVGRAMNDSGKPAYRSERSPDSDANAKDVAAGGEGIGDLTQKKSEDGSYVTPDSVAGDPGEAVRQAWRANQNCRRVMEQP